MVVVNCEKMISKVMSREDGSIFSSFDYSIFGSEMIEDIEYVKDCIDLQYDDLELFYSDFNTFERIEKL